MLQIASGKLFAQAAGQRNELRGVIHTNLQLMGSKPISTDAGRLVPTNYVSQLSGQLVYEFTELIEQPAGSGALASHGIDPYLSDFAAIASMALNATCTVDPETASRLIGGKRSTKVAYPPQEFIPRAFDPQIWIKEEDAGLLEEIANALIAMCRKSFLASMRAIRTYATAMHRIADDLELAYVLFVASVESLAQGFDDFQPTWQDYDGHKRRRIDDALRNIDEDAASEIRAVLLEAEQRSLGKRFREFAMEHTSSSYFRDDAVEVVNPAGRADLECALREAYKLRSRYVHSLHELPGQLSISTMPGETVRVEGKTLLTLRGLARLARHVMIEFIRRQPQVEREKYDYSRERAGIVHLPMAPQYWVGNPDNLSPQSGKKRLSGFLQQLTACMSGDGDARITDLSDVLKKAETMFSTMSDVERRPFLALYFLYNGVVPEENRMPNLNSINKKYWAETASPSIEGMLTRLLLGVPVDWPIERHCRINDDYFAQRDKGTGLRMPRGLEAGISLALAERYRAKNEAERARECIRRAVENHPGNNALLVLEREFSRSSVVNWRRVLFPSVEEATGGGDEKST